jgi:hypothetical protein
MHMSQSFLPHDFDFGRLPASFHRRTDHLTSVLTSLSALLGIHHQNALMYLHPAPFDSIVSPSCRHDSVL